jgi:hypothetical protein
MIRDKLVDAIVPSPPQVLDLIVRAESHRKFAWTAGRVLKEAALWTRIEDLDFEERKLVLRRITNLLETLAVEGILQQRADVQSIGYGSEVGFDYVRPRAEQVSLHPPNQ